MPKVPKIKSLQYLCNNEKTYYFEKDNTFNVFFSNASQYQTTAFFREDNRLCDINLNYKKILKVIQSLNPNKAHGHDGVSVRMLKLKSTFHNITSQLFCNC